MEKEIWIPTIEVKEEKESIKVKEKLPEDLEAFFKRKEEEIIIDFNPEVCEEHGDFLDIDKWREDIKEAAKETLGMSEEEACEFINKEAPIDELEDAFMGEE